MVFVCVHCFVFVVHVVVHVARIVVHTSLYLQCVPVWVYVFDVFGRHVGRHTIHIITFLYGLFLHICFMFDTVHYVMCVWVV